MICVYYNSTNLRLMYFRDIAKNMSFYACLMPVYLFLEGVFRAMMHTHES